MHISIENKDGKFRAEFDDDGEVKDIIETNTKKALINMITQIIEERLDEEVGIVMDPETVLKMLTRTAMRSFTNDDRLAFQGCESKDPMIGEFDDFTIVVDGNSVNVVHNKCDDDGTFFELKLVGID